MVLKNMENEVVKDQLFEWIKEAENTNEYCERNMMTDAILALKEDPPDVKRAISRLATLTPLIGESALVKPPEFVKEL